MSASVNGIYRSGHVRLLETPDGVEGTEVVVTFPDHAGATFEPAARESVWETAAAQRRRQTNGIWGGGRCDPRTNGVLRYTWAIGGRGGQGEEVKTTTYFEAMRTRPDRAGIRYEWIELARDFPVREYVQADRRIRRWVQVPEAGGRFLRVILLADGETVHNAFFDRGFIP